MMYLCSYQTSLPNLLSTLNDFHPTSGLGVNPAKCSALPINIPQHTLTTLKDSFDIALSDSTLQYLGIRLAPSLQAMYNANYPQTFSKVTKMVTLLVILPYIFVREDYSHQNVYPPKTFVLFLGPYPCMYLAKLLN